MASCECGCTPEDGCSSCIFIGVEVDNPTTRVREDWLGARMKKVMEKVLEIERATPERLREMAEEARRSVGPT